MADLNTHKRFHLIDLPFTCQLCVMAFGTASELAIHEQLHSSILQNSLNKNGEVPSSDIEHVPQANGQPSAPGLISDHMLNFGQGLKMAQLSVADNKAEAPEDHKHIRANGKMNNGEPDLDMKKLMKIVNKPFKCSQCGKAFVSTTELAGHVRIHTGQRPFKCSQCDNCYRTQSTLAVHMKSHEKEKRYKCTYCEVTCPTLSKLYDHYMLHQSQKPLEGSQPNNHFAQERVIRIDDEEILPFRCWVCQKRFSDQLALDHHISLHRDRSSTLESCVKKLKSSITEK